jgi:hypothetical protein
MQQQQLLQQMGQDTIQQHVTHTIMTQKQLQEFRRLTDIFDDMCSHITTLLVRLDGDFKHTNIYTLDGDEVWCEGDEYGGYGGHEHYSKSFPASLLTLSDNAINQWITIELKKKEDEKKRMDCLYPFCCPCIFLCSGNGQCAGN